MVEAVNNHRINKHKPLQGGPPTIVIIGVVITPLSKVKQPGNPSETHLV